MLKLKKKPKKPNGVVDYDPTSVLDMFIDVGLKEAKGPGGAKTETLLEHVSTMVLRLWMISRAKHLISTVLSILSQGTLPMCFPRKSRKTHRCRGKPLRKRPQPLLPHQKSFPRKIGRCSECILWPLNKTVYECESSKGLLMSLQPSTGRYIRRWISTSSTSELLWITERPNRSVDIHGEYLLR